MSYERERVEYITAECDADGCEKNIDRLEHGKAQSLGWLFFRAPKGDRKTNKAFCPEHRGMIASSIDEFFTEDDIDD